MMSSAAGQSAGRGCWGSERVEDGVAASDGVEGAEDGVVAVGETVVEHPLDLADPDGDAGEFSGVVIDLDAVDDAGIDGGEGHGDAEGLRAPLDASFSRSLTHWRAT